MIQVLTSGELDPIINHPFVRPWLGEIESGELHSEDLLCSGNAVALGRPGEGALLYVRLEPGVYEVHTQMTPEVRGKVALAMARESLNWMFTRTDAMEIYTKVPGNNGRAGVFAVAAGMTRWFRRELAWEGSLPIHYYQLHYNGWVMQDRTLTGSGAYFHNIVPHDHTPDLSHDRHVGAAVQMVIGGQTDKGLILYNRWARLAGYGLVGLESRDPIIITFGDIRLTLENGEIKCL